MSRWVVILGIAVLALLGVLFWKLSDKPSKPEVDVAGRNDAPHTGDKDPPVTTREDAAPEVVWRHPDNRASGDRDGGAPVALLDPESEAFHRRIDVVVADHLRESAAFDCDESGIDPNAVIKLNYKVRIVNGRTTISDVRIMKSEVPKAYEECYIRHVSAHSFQMDDMPDFEEGDQELFTRVRSMKKYRSRAEFDKD